jgi:hypothetical protein
MQMNDLIDRLVGELEPERRLKPPAQRAATWVLASAAYIIAMVRIVGVRADVSRVDPYALSALVAAACFAALGAFHRVIPGRAYRAAHVAGGAAGLLWLFLAARVVDVDTGTGWPCVARIAAFGVGPAIGCAVMLARARSTDVRLAVAAWLPAGALAMFATKLACGKDGARHVLLWHAGPVVAGLVLAIWLAPSIVRAWQQRSSS